MTSDRSDRAVVTWLAGEAQPRLPDYFDDLLAQTARSRQRPAWRFPGRWLPMAVLTRTPQWASPVPIRLVLIIALIAIIAALAVGGGGPRPLPAPPPFGIAQNGRILIAANDDIVSVDPVTGTRSMVVGGPDVDLSPVFSRDGSRIAFARDIDGPFVDKVHLFVVGADGTGRTQITREPVEMVRSMEFSPDGRSVLVVSSAMISIIASDGSGMTTFNLGIAAGWASFRPDGTSIAFTRIDPPAGLYLVDADGSDPRPIVTAARGDTVELPQWSPDGRSIVYSTWPIDSIAVISEVRIVSADGTGDRQVGGPGPGAWEARGVWSNRGDRLAMMRGYLDTFADVSAVSVNVAESTEIESDPLMATTDCCWAIEWAPDDTKVLITPVGPGSVPTVPILFDPQTGRVEPVPGAESGWSTWQRLAPSGP